MRDEDLSFSQLVYASTREEELAATGWPAEMKQAFLSQQHEAQHRHYRQHYEGAQWLIVEQDGVPVGRLYRAEWPQEIRIIDIALLPEGRGQGIGAAIVSAIQEEARALGKAVSIHVEKHNRARSLYQRLGFRVVGDAGVYDLMEWEADAGA